MSIVKSFIGNPKIKNYFIFIGVLLPSIQILFLIHLYGVNVPFWDEWDFIPIIHSFLNGDPSWIQQIFSQHNEHRLFFPSLIFLSNVVSSSWNLVVQMYLSWTILGTCLVVLYLFLKKTGTVFTWLVIPIALIMYSPSQWENFLWGFQVQWFLVLATFLWSLYFLNMPNKFSIVPSTVLGVVSSFSLVAGLLVWPIGLLSILTKKANKKWNLVIWLISGTLVYVSYFHNYSQPTKHPIILTLSTLPKFFEYVLTYLSGPFYIPFNFLRIVVSIFVILTIISGIVLYKKRNNEFTRVLPWLQLGLFAFFTSLMSSAGRLSFGIDQSLSSRYITISNLFEISGLVFLCISFIVVKDSLKKSGYRKLLYSLFICILFVGVVSIGINNVMGWQWGKNRSEWITSDLACFNVPLHPFDGCKIFYPDVNTLLNETNTLVRYKLSYFSNSHLDPTIRVDQLLDLKNWSSMNYNGKGYGNIDTVNGIILIPKQVNVDSNVITINGWILDENKKTVNKLFLFIDGKPFLQMDKFDHAGGMLANFTPRPDVVKALVDADLNSGWSFSFFSAYLNEGCHHISVRAANGTYYNEISSNSEICIKYT